jgi:hypothetical protein
VTALGFGRVNRAREREEGGAPDGERREKWR